MVYAYTRISTDKQDSARQVEEIVAYCKAHTLGNPVIIQETASGAGERPQLEETIERLSKGDCLAVWELSRLTRGGVSALFQIIGRVRDRGAQTIETKSGTVIDTSVAGEAYVFALGLASRIERDLISDRTKSALRARKASGVKLGRPAGKSKLDARIEEIEKYRSLGLNATAICKLIGCSRGTYENWQKRNKHKVV
jgi:DNA invertase Pin-like site-specific DNA recombinase